MGEIAEMMLDGTLCEGCGVYMGHPNGYPVRCSHCRKEERIARANPPPIQRAHCPKCQKKVKAIGLKDHMRDAHGE